MAEEVPTPLPAMLGGIMEHVATLAEDGETSARVVPRIVIEMRAGEDDLGHPHPGQCEPTAQRHLQAAI